MPERSSTRSRLKIDTNRIRICLIDAQFVSCDCAAFLLALNEILSRKNDKIMERRKIETRLKPITQRFSSQKMSATELLGLLRVQSRKTTQSTSRARQQLESKKVLKNELEFQRNNYLNLEIRCNEIFSMKFDFVDIGVITWDIFYRFEVGPQGSFEFTVTPNEVNVKLSLIRGIAPKNGIENNVEDENLQRGIALLPKLGGLRCLLYSSRPNAGKEQTES